MPNSIYCCSSNIIYMIIPNLPNSGMILDMKENTYLGQVFGPNSYFQDGFTYMMSLLFLFMGLAYGIGAKTFKNDKELLEEAGKIFFKNWKHNNLNIRCFTIYCNLQKDKYRNNYNSMVS